MSLPAGTRLGPYEVVAPLGAGGMGEVYKATDTRLKRTVAIKILPPDFAMDLERQQRFEREARLVASLSHPNICALHDIGTQDTSAGPPVSYLVMEFLEGETLAARLTRGALPLDETLRIGSSIARALAAAHREGIVHRDLKPANVMLTRSGVKLLDFGIAKAIDPTVRTGSLSTKAVTLATAEGTVPGTIPYMAPEQLEGKPVDARSDIFAFGAVLYEMATGRRAFPGNGFASIATNILSATPAPLSATPTLDRIVRGCLEKDPDLRWQSAQDVALQLTMAAERDAAVEAAPKTTWLPWAIAAAAVILAAAALLWRRAEPAAVPETGFDATVKFSMMPPPPPDGFSHNVEAPPMAVSPDGTKIAFLTVSRAGESRVWLRALASLDAKVVDGTEGATSVFWSPDSRSLAFFARGKLKRVAAAGGAPVPICDVRQDIGQTGTWGAGSILFASVQGEGIFTVPESGGTAAELLKPEKGEQRFTWPSFLPDGKRFTFLKVTNDDRAVLMLASAGAAPQEIVAARSNAQYVAPGYLLYAEDGTLIARRFDPATAQLSGSPVAIADPVFHFYPTALAHFSASQTGVVAYQQHRHLARIAWFDRTGKELGVLRPLGGYGTLKLSADERQLLFDRTSPSTNAQDLYLLEIDRAAEVQLTSEPGAEFSPQWGGRTIVYARTKGRPPRLYRRSMTSAADEPIGPEGRGLQQPTDTSRDGAWALYVERSARGDFDIHALHLSDGRVVALRDSRFNEVEARFSPDGRYVAYTSNEGGRLNVYVMPFEGTSATRAVSTGGATTPRWSPDGRQLYYVAVPNEGDQVYVTSVSVTPGPVLQFGAPSPLFPLPPGRRWIDFAPTRDGRFLTIQHVQFAGMQPLTILVNALRGETKN